MLLMVGLSSFLAGAAVLFAVEAAGVAAMSKQWMDLDYID